MGNNYTIFKDVWINKVPKLLPNMVWVKMNNSPKISVVSKTDLPKTRKSIKNPKNSQKRILFGSWPRRFLESAIRGPGNLASVNGRRIRWPGKTGGTSGVYFPYLWAVVSEGAQIYRDMQYLLYFHVCTSKSPPSPNGCCRVAGGLGVLNVRWSWTVVPASAELLSGFGMDGTRDAMFSLSSLCLFLAYVCVYLRLFVVCVLFFCATGHCEILGRNHVIDVVSRILCGAKVRGPVVFRSDLDGCRMAVRRWLPLKEAYLEAQEASVCHVVKVRRFVIRLQCLHFEGNCRYFANNPKLTNGLNRPNVKQVVGWISWLRWELTKGPPPANEPN